MKSHSHRITSHLIRYRYALLVLGIILFGIAIPFSQRLSLDRNITTMFAPDDPTLVDYQVLQKSFGGNAVVMLVYRDPNLMSREGIDRSKLISAQVENIPGVSGVLSPSTLNAALEKIRPGSFFRSDSEPPGLTRSDDVVARGMDVLFSGYTHSEDHALAAVVAMLDPEHSSSTITELQRVAQSLPAQFDVLESAGVVVGEPVLIHDGFDLIERDGRKLATVTLALLSIVVLFTLMDLRFVGLTIAVVVWSVVVTEAVTYGIGMDRSLVSSIMTAIITVISVAAVLHLGVKYQRNRAKGHDALESTTASLSALLIPIFWTCMTDAAGFAALAGSRILPVRQFGWMIAIASVAVFVAILLFGAAAMMLPELSFGKRLHALQQRLTQMVVRRCSMIASVMVAHRRSVMISGLILMVVAVAGTWHAKPETSFLNNFRSDSAIVVAYDQVEREFGGAGVWDVILPAPDVLSKEYLAEVRVLERQLREIDTEGVRLTKVISMADADFVVGLVPLLKFAPPTLRMAGMRATMPHYVDALLTPEHKTPAMLRIMLRSEEQLPAEKKTALINEVRRRVDEFTRSSRWREITSDREVTQDDADYRVTGYYVMMSQLVSQLVGDQWRCLAIAAILVWLLLWFATGSLKLSIAALLPNLLPAFIVLAVVGVGGGKINMGAAMIAAVSIGLSIDGSVHLLANFQRLRARGHNVRNSVVHAAGNVGVPVLLATFALVAGFSILSTSEFIPTATFGILVAATLFLGTVINLTLLPACVAMFETE